MLNILIIMTGEECPIMNSKALLHMCVILAACRMCLWIFYWWKEEKAQVTQSNINKNTPQQLTDKDLFGNETTLAVSEEDIQAALDGDEFRVPLNSPVILVQSGNRAPETIMQEEMRKYYTVSTFSGIPDRQKPLTCNKTKIKWERGCCQCWEYELDAGTAFCGCKRTSESDYCLPWYIADRKIWLCAEINSMVRL